MSDDAPDDTADEIAKQLNDGVYTFHQGANARYEAAKALREPTIAKAQQAESRRPRQPLPNLP